MNYNEIIDLALNYADRTDTETVNRMPSFLRIVESRLNRKLKVGEMSTRTVTTTVEGQEYYSLPEDFASLRDIEIRDSLESSEKKTLRYVSPERSNYWSGSSADPLYTLIANQVQIIPRQAGGKIVEVIYYKRVPQLSEVNPTTWLSIKAPDLYVFGLLTEINAFVKDKEAAAAWNERFISTLAEITEDDAVTRWSSPFLQPQISTT